MGALRAAVRIPLYPANGEAFKTHAPLWASCIELLSLPANFYGRRNLDAFWCVANSLFLLSFLTVHSRGRLSNERPYPRI